MSRTRRLVPAVVLSVLVVGLSHAGALASAGGNPDPNACHGVVVSTAIDRFHFTPNVLAPILGYRTPGELQQAINAGDVFILADNGIVYQCSR